MASNRIGSCSLQVVLDNTSNRYIDRHLVDTSPSMGQVLVEYPSLCQPSVDRVSVMYRLNVDQYVGSYLVDILLWSIDVSAENVGDLSVNYCTVDYQ